MNRTQRPNLTSRPARTDGPRNFAGTSLRKFLPILALPFAIAVQAEPAFYQGSIGDKIGFSIEVDPADSHTAGTVTYDTTGADGLILEVTPGRPCGLPWKESLYSRVNGQTKPTGVFNGSLSNDAKTAEGIWTSSDGKKTLPYKLTRTARMLEIKSNVVDAKATYPEIEGPRYSQLNKLLTDEAKHHQDANIDWVKETQKELQEVTPPKEGVSAVFRWRLARLESVSDGLVSLSYRNAEFEGGAHPNTIFSGINYQIAVDGTPKRLELWDLLNKTDANIQTISDLLIKDLKRQNATYIKDGSVKHFKNSLGTDGVAFVILPSGIAFIFSQYEVGPYAEGDFRVVVPYSKLASALRADGPLAHSAAKP